MCHMSHCHKHMTCQLYSVQMYIHAEWKTFQLIDEMKIYFVKCMSSYCL